MKKRIIATLVTGALVAGVSFAAMADQVKNSVVVDGKYHVDYNSTTSVAYDNPSYSGNLNRLKEVNQFKADGKSNYPYEIYLPNETDPGNYRIHTNYTKDTDACASCHSTHTAVGDSLLQWYSVRDTCFACHDGTVTTTYNVEDGRIGTGKPAFGGMFGNGVESSLSAHNVSGAVEIAAAPGGSIVAEKKDKAGNPLNWKVEFGCESCHTPHGLGGNARILHPDANYAASSRANSNGYANIQSVAGEAYKVVAPTDAKEGLIAGIKPGDYYYFLSGYPYTVTVYNGDTKLKAGTDYTLSNVNGYTQITPIGSTAITKVYGTPSLKVRMKINGYLTQSENVEHLNGMNAFCGACHTDYNTANADTYERRVKADGTVYSSNDKQFHGSAGEETGVYSKAHRHQVGFQWHAPGAPGLKFETDQGGLVDSNYDGTPETAGKFGMECLTCHVAHGTSSDYWYRTIAQTPVTPEWAGMTTATLTEIAGSSALKRMPNMGVCEACHDKSAGNEGYAALSGTVSSQTTTTKDAGQAAATFVGTSKCIPCHEETVKEYQNTAHSKMNTFTTEEDRTTWVARLAEENPDWADGTATYTLPDSTTLTFTKDNLKLNVSWDKNSLAGVATENGKIYILYENEYFAEPEEYGCISCHNTPKNVASSDWATFKANHDAGKLELGISCETQDCHGNGSLHIQNPSSKNISNPALLDMQVQTQKCGTCHGSRHHNGEFWKPIWADLNNSHSDDAFEMVDANKGPSPMYLSGAVSCVTCHTPHSNTVQDVSRNGVAKKDLQLKMPVRALCNSCHEGMMLTTDDFNKYLPLKVNGMPSHVFKGQGTIPGTPYDPATVKEHRAE